MPLAERGLAVGVAIWHGLPGSVLLHGAVAVHVALALTAIYQRQALRLAPLELLRKGCHEFNADYRQIVTDENYEKVLADFLTERTRMASAAGR